jgi:hypothetical protein
LNEGQSEGAANVVVDVRRKRGAAGKQKPDAAADEASHLPEDECVLMSAL